MTYGNGNGNGHGVRLGSLVSPILTVIVLVLGMMFASSKFVTKTDLISSINQNAPYLQDKEKILGSIENNKKLQNDINEIKLEQSRISTKLDILLEEYRKRR